MAPSIVIISGPNLLGGDVAVEEPNYKEGHVVAPHAPFDPISIVTTLAAERVVGAAH